MLALIAVLAFSAPGPSTSPLGPRVPIAGERSQVVNIATLHLSEAKTFDPHNLAPLLDKLAAFKPQIITFEGVSGEQCAALRNADRYGDAFDSYCWDLAEIEKATGFSTTAALAEIRKTMADWPANPTAAQRRRLAMLFIAAGNRPSAQVQWLRLQPAERRAGDGVDKVLLLPILNRASGKLNENYDIAAALAARLGLERVYGVDDHSSDAVLAHAPEAYGKAMEARFAAFRSSPLFTESQRDMKSLTSPAAVMAYYRKINRAHAMDAQIRADFGGALAARDDGALWGRQYVGWWEVRNLRMAANVRETFAGRPGARVLNLVGSSHKAWYDALMRMMSDVDVVDAEALLR